MFDGNTFKEDNKIKIMSMSNAGTGYAKKKGEIGLKINK
jgi:hypothetical protein